MTPERLEQIRAREAKATPGPWTECGGAVYANELDDPLVIFPPAEQDKTDALFAAHARQDIPDLLAEIDRLRTDNDRLDNARDMYCAAGRADRQEADRLRAALHEIADDPEMTGYCARELAAKALRGQA